MTFGSPMMRRTRTLVAQVAIAISCLVLPLAAQAELKIATLDLKKIFDGYFKTKQADLQLKERAAEVEKILKGMLDDYQKASEEYKTVSAGAADQAVSAEERERRKKSAEAKLLEIQEIERSVRQYRQDNFTRLEEQKRRMRDNVLREIREVITKKARESSYNLVLDSSAESRHETQFLLFAQGQVDLTDEILSQLNANAPTGLLNQDAKDDKSKK